MLAPAPGTAPWSLPRRLFFRGVLVYLVLYNLPFPCGHIPGTGFAANGFEAASDAALAWFGKHVLGVEKSLAPFITGSGDTTRSYVALAMHANLAVIVAGFWSLLSRKTEHVRLADRLRTYVRFVLGVTMLGYGTAKFFGGQFSNTDGAWLFTTWGESSPMGVVWKFMAASPAYTTFTGVVECLGGLLLFWRRTTALGAMVTSAGMLNVMMINFCYDVPVKLYSAHLLLMAMGLLLRDAPRLASVLLWHRQAEPLPLRLPSATWVFWLERVAKLAFVGWILFQSGSSVYPRWQRQGAPAEALDGLYEVAEFVRDGTVVPPLLTEATRWQYVFLSKNSAQLAMSDGKTRVYYQPVVDAAQATVTLKPFSRPGATGEAAAPVVLNYHREPASAGGEREAAEAAATDVATTRAREATGKPEVVPTPVPAPAAVAEPKEASLVLEGTYKGAAICVRLRERPSASFLLRERGFRWINEYPFNR